MGDLSKYWIEIIGLKKQTYNYSYEIKDSFFQNFEESELTSGSLKCLVKLIKTDNYINLEFRINGTVVLTCDRSLDKFDFDVKTTNNMLFKFGEEDMEIDDEVEIISRTRQGIDVSQYIYEFIATSIPMKRLHPRYRDEEKKEEGDNLIYSSSTEKKEDKEEKKGTEDIDPRWKDLLKIRNQLN